MRSRMGEGQGCSRLRPDAQRRWVAFVFMVVALAATGLNLTAHVKPALAQLRECSPQAYHHEGCDDGSGPDVGKWAWNPGEPCNWPGLGVVGNVHWWVQFSWHDPARFEALRARDGDLPSLEFAFYDAQARCGCDLEVLRVRTRHHLHPPERMHMLYSLQPGGCAGTNTSVAKAYFLSTRSVFRQVNYDLSVDAQARFDRDRGGQADLIWEADGSAEPVAGCPGNPRARAWLGGLRYCVDLRLRSTNPGGICCSTSHANPLCWWSPCDS